MRIHRMRLDALHYEEVLAGRKKVEIRLNDLKRQIVRAGDKLEFSLRTNNTKKIVVSISRVRKFPDLEALFEFYEITSFGNVWACSKDAINSIDYYRDNDIEKYGLIAIEIVEPAV